jgi:Uma2 family endonuclease
VSLEERGPDFRWFLDGLFAVLLQRRHDVPVEGDVRDHRLAVLFRCVFAKDYNILQPDVLVTPAPLPRDAAEAGIPLLLGEVLSPSTAKRDRDVKTGIYLGAGVEEVWIVDADAKSNEIHTSGGVKVFTGSARAASGVVPGFELVPDRLF